MVSPLVEAHNVGETIRRFSFARGVVPTAPDDGWRRTPAESARGVVPYGAHLWKGTHSDGMVHYCNEQDRPNGTGLCMTSRSTPINLINFI